MKILFLSINYWPEQTGIAPVNTWRCEYLAKQGHDVTMCTSFPYYPNWRTADEYRGRLLQREKHNGVEILRSWMWVPRAPAAMKRILFEASFLASTLARAFAYPIGSSDTWWGSRLTRRKPDLLYIVSPPLGLAMTAVLLSRWWRIPYVFDVMDLQPDAAVDLGMLRDGHLMKGLYALERVAYRNAALVTTLTEGMREKIIGKGVAADKVKVFPARADDQLFDLRMSQKGDEFRRKFGLEDKFLVLHSGAMGVKQGLEVILNAAKFMQHDPKLLFLLVGDGAVRSELQCKTVAMGLNNVKFLPVQSPQAFAQMLATADIALVTQRKSVSDIVFPSKTVSYLASGCPVIASVNQESEIARVICSSGAGMVVSPEEPKALASAIQRLRFDPEALSRMSQAASEYAREHWDGARILPAMNRELMAVAGKNSSNLLEFNAPAAHEPPQNVEDSSAWQKPAVGEGPGFRRRVGKAVDLSL